MCEKRFIADLDQLHEMLGFIEEFCAENEFDPITVNKILLATEEALVNVIHHGYSNQGHGYIELDCEKTEHPGVKICIRDQGIPFDPREKAKKIKTTHHTPAEDPSIGGYGIYLYNEIMDSVEYQRTNGVNILCLIKYLD